MKFFLLLCFLISLSAFAVKPDKREDRHDLREDKRDALHQGGKLDKAEDVRDSNEDKRETRRESRRGSRRQKSH